MGRYINEMSVTLMSNAAERGEEKYGPGDVQAIVWELEWARGLALSAGIDRQRLGLESETYAERLRKEAER